MTQKSNSESIDIDGLRKQVSTGVNRRVEGGGEPSPKKDGPGLNKVAHLTAVHFSTQSFSGAMFRGYCRVAEFVALLGFGTLMCTVVMSAPVVAPFLFAMILIFSALLTVTVLQFADAYSIPVLRSRRREIPRVWIAWTLSFLPVPFMMPLALQPGLSTTGLFAAWYVGGIAFLAMERLVLAMALRRWARNGVLERRAVIVGGGQPVKDLIRDLEMQPDNDIRICGIFDDRDAARSPAIIAGYPKLGTVDELVEFARIAHIDLLIIALPLSAEARIMAMLKTLWVLPLDIRIAAHADGLKFRPRTVARAAAPDMVNVFDKPIRDWDGVAKRIFDLFFTIFALSLLWPVFIASAIAVKATSKGPVFFVQKRHGLNNEVINVFKFRSMYTNLADQTARQAVTKGDPRVTPVGRFLRKSSIDELPQLFNVLMGTLSLVGPRPHAVLAQTADRKYVEVVDTYFARHRVKPGVTGWAQINGWRGEIDNDEKIQARTACDLYYIENWSLLLDLKILFLTPVRLLNTDNAY